MSDAVPQTYSAAHLPSDPTGWPLYRKHALTRAVRMAGAFNVRTSEGLLPTGWPLYRKHALTRAVRMAGAFNVRTSEGLLHCEDGYLALDARGYPYPIAADEFGLIYTPAPAPDGPGAEVR